MAKHLYIFFLLSGFLNLNTKCMNDIETAIELKKIHTKHKKERLVKSKKRKKSYKNEKYCSHIDDDAVKTFLAKKTRLSKRSQSVFLHKINKATNVTILCFKNNQIVGLARYKKRTKPYGLKTNEIKFCCCCYGTEYEQIYDPLKIKKIVISKNQKKRSMRIKESIQAFVLKKYYQIYK